MLGRRLLRLHARRQSLQRAVPRYAADDLPMSGALARSVSAMSNPSSRTIAAWTCGLRKALRLVHHT
jgi:hypothetical protein